MEENKNKFTEDLPILDDIIKKEKKAKYANTRKGHNFH